MKLFSIGMIIYITRQLNNLKNYYRKNKKFEILKFDEFA